jgi:hypothetical protein
LQDIFPGCGVAVKIARKKETGLQLMFL